MDLQGFLTVAVASSLVIMATGQTGTRPGVCKKEIGDSSKKECHVDDDCSKNKKCCPNEKGGTLCRHPATSCDQLECPTCHIDGTTGLPTCAVDGSWGPWGVYGSCSVTCEEGQQVRSRDCDSPAPAYGGAQCSGQGTESQSCNPGPCPVDGSWGPWGSYGSCSVTCGEGDQVRSRDCDSPPPANGGAQCPGQGTESQSCNPGPCPVDGNWGPWGDYGSCSVTCGEGQQVRSRDCDSPPPANRGAQCPGQGTESQSCNPGPCQTICPAGWSFFQDSCYLFVQQSKTWCVAEVICQALQGYLVKIDSGLENTFLGNMMRQSGTSETQAWIGLQDLVEENQFLWSTGESPAYTNWNTGEPNDTDGSQDCVQLNTNVNDGWNVSPCGLAKYYICERPILSSPS